MTLDEFFVELEKVKDQFPPWISTQIRSKETILSAWNDDTQDYYTMCPICVVARNVLKQDFFNSEFQRAGEHLELAHDDIINIAKAADAELTEPIVGVIRDRMIAVLKS